MRKRMVPPDYFVSPVPSLWTLDEMGEAIDWKDTQTTAIMLPHLNLICRALADQLKGLPSLTAVLLTVEALSRGCSMELAQQRLSRLVATSGDLSSMKFMLPHLMKWLYSLQSLDTEFRHGVGAHIAFLCELFEQFPREWLETNDYQTAQVLQWLENILGDRGNLLSTRLKDEPAAAAKALTVLDFLSVQAFSAESLQLRLRTGLDRLPSGEALDIVERFPIAALARQLANQSDDLSLVARMAQAVSATISLPRLPSDPDVLPIGGVSDVTNRGQPDRLLMSELALDSDLLIARIANGQALYLRREQPPQPESKHRCLMIEAGVRTWGTMRLYTAAFALGLCIAQERRGGEPVDVVTIAGDSAWLEEFTTRSGLMRFYERLLPDVHPGEALMDLVKRNRLNLDMTNQPIVVLSEATDRDAQYQSVTRGFPKPHMVARVQRSGWVELLERSAAGDQTLQNMRLENSTKTEDRHSTAPSVIGPERLPAFLNVIPCPLRFSIELEGPCVQAAGTATPMACWVLTHDRRVMLLDERTHGAREIGYAPGGRVLASCIPKHNSWLLVIESTPHASKLPMHLLVRADANRGVTTCELKLRDEKHSQVTYCFDQSHLLRIGKHLTFLDSRTGRELAAESFKYPHLGELFFGKNAIYAAILRGDSIKWQWLDRLPSAIGSAARLKRSLPVVYAHDLSWMMQLTGDRPAPRATGIQIQTSQPHSMMRVNWAGTEMLVALKDVTSSTDSRLTCGPREQRFVRLSLTEPKVTYQAVLSPGQLAAFDTSQQWLFYQSRNVRTRLSGLSFRAGTLIAHAHGKRYALQFENGTDSTHLTWCQLAAWDPPTIQYKLGRPFRPVQRPYSKWKLRHAKLPSGDAWLDSRGLLHLRAIDGSELSLVLVDGQLAGWHSSGQVFGSEYFVAGTSATSQAPPEVIDWLTSFATMQT